MILNGQSDLFSVLQQLNTALRKQGRTMFLKIVGSASLMFAQDTPFQSEDIDNLTLLDDDDIELLYDLNIDINSDALDYEYLYKKCEFEYCSDYSNINISYLAFPDAIRTKMNNLEDDVKILSLAYYLNQELHISLDVSSITNYIEENWDTYVDQSFKETIAIWLEQCEHFGYLAPGKDGQINLSDYVI